MYEKSPLMQMSVFQEHFEHIKENLEDTLGSKLESLDTKLKQIQRPPPRRRKKKRIVPLPTPPVSATTPVPTPIPPVPAATAPVPAPTPPVPAPTPAPTPAPPAPVRTLLGPPVHRAPTQPVVQMGFSNNRVPTPIISPYVGGLHSYPPIRHQHQSRRTHVLPVRRKLWLRDSSDEDEDVVRVGNDTFYEEMELLRDEAAHKRRVKRALGRLASGPISKRRRRDTTYR